MEVETTDPYHPVYQGGADEFVTAILLAFKGSHSATDSEQVPSVLLTLHPNIPGEIERRGSYLLCATQGWVCMGGI